MEPHQSIPHECNECSRINCTGCGVHHVLRLGRTQIGGEVHKIEYNIPNCRTCGVELIDLLEQLEIINLRNQKWCVICGHQYTHSTEHFSHFPMHFMMASSMANLDLQCIECTPNPDDFLLKCHICPKTFRTEQSKKKHFNQVHSEHLLYPCSLCDRKFVRAADVQNHERRKHRIIKRRGYLGPHSCRICPRPEKFETATAKQEHERVNHIDHVTGKFVCPICKKLYANAAKTIEHLIIHNERKFICDQCGKNFIRLTNLQAHTRSVHATSYDFRCKVCPDKKYTNLLALQRHERAKHSDNPYTYPCDMCDRIFYDHTDRRRHRWTHGGFPKPFACLVCGKAFHENKQLRLHMKSHKGPDMHDDASNVVGS